MPAYFTMTVVYDRRSFDYNTLEMVHRHLDYAGLEFRSGYWKSKDDTYHDIVWHNQELMDKNFIPSPDDDIADSYKQMCFKFGGFSEIRGILRNCEPDANSFCYDILIPESDVCTEEGSGILDREEIGKLIGLAKGIWRDPLVRMIQTNFESDDECVPEADILSGKLPNIHPFAVVSETMAEKLNISDYRTIRFFPSGVVIL